jgi:vacuolar iron transporter family protein
MRMTRILGAVALVIGLVLLGFAYHASNAPMDHALGAHARDELGISEATTARPVQAALTSAATFATGAVLPLSVVLVSPPAMLVPMVSIASLVFLGLLGAIGALAGGANVLRATLRVTFWGALAMGLTAGIGALVGTAV